MKRFFSALTALILIFLCASCSESGAGKSFTYPLDNSPATIDPQYASDTAARTVITNTFEGLVRLDPEGKIIPGIAESWSVSSDGLVYTFKLREGTEWYCPAVLKKEYGDEFFKRFSSEKVTANDFVFACQRAVSLGDGAARSHRLSVIENAPEIIAGTKKAEELGVSAPDANTFVIRLRTPCGDMLERLTESEFMPCNKDFFEAMGGRYGLTNKHIMCNGPFYVSAWDPEVSLTVKANKYYAGEQEVKPSSVTFIFDSDPESIAKKLSSGDISAALLSPDCPVPDNTETASEKANSVFGILFNCSDKFLSNKNLRLAFCHSVNRNLFAPQGDSMKPMFGFIPESCSAGNKPYREAAGGQTPMLNKKENYGNFCWSLALEELEVSKIGITVLCPEWLESPVRQQLQVWQKVMGIGLGITVEVRSEAEISEAVSSGNYQIAFGSFEAENDSAVDFLASFSDGGIFRFDSEEYRLIIERLMQVSSDRDLVNGCYTAENHIIREGICLPLYSRSSRFVFAEDTADIYMPGTNGTVCFINAKRFD